MVEVLIPFPTPVMHRPNELGGSATVGRNAGDLNDDTDDHNSGTQEDTLATSELVTEDEDEDGTKQTTDGIDGDDETLVGRVILDFRERILEGGSRDDSTHDTLVITEE